MRRVFAEINRQNEILKSDEVFLKVRNISGVEAAALLKVWGPLFVHMTMTFRDVNLMYNAYEHPQNDFERAINGHAYVDATHWEMLVTDLESLGAADQVKKYKDAMSIIWSDQGKPIRDYMYWVMHRAQRCGSSHALKITAMESCESTVKTFLTQTRHISMLFKRETGVTLNYFGESHIESEVVNAVDLSIFDEIELDQETLTTALWIVNSHFQDFKVFVGCLFDCLHQVRKS
ncbi:hypothetical protein [Pseudomonas koreensis]|uniref:hypothetical protein n=1 Tax=Pseudomonas koreensis TaxID=198620 RepID=UPI00320A72A0